METLWSLEVLFLRFVKWDQSSSHCQADYSLDRKMGQSQGSPHFFNHLSRISVLCCLVASCLGLEKHYCIYFVGFFGCFNGEQK